MDHPGFEAGKMIGPHRLRAVWRGGVSPEYFRGTRVRFFDNDRWTRGTIRSIRLTREDGRRRVDSVTVEVPRAVAPGAVGMWDLPDPTIRGSRIRARGCDDIASLAAILAAFDELQRTRRSLDVYALFTRAEEVGFAGAIAAAQSGLLPKRARVVAVETSAQIPGAAMGNGPILRVGDRASIFSPHLTRFCRQVADDLARRDRRFRFQRRLMDGGTCESTAFGAYGFDATGLCIALGNYHNMDRRRKRIAPEYVDLSDFGNLIKWFIALATSKRTCETDDATLRKSLQRLDRKWSPQLERTAKRRALSED